MRGERPVVMFVALMFVVLAACGDNGDGGDTILTGFSGVIIFGIVAWVVWQYVRKKK